MKLAGILYRYLIIFLSFIRRCYLKSTRGKNKNTNKSEIVQGVTSYCKHIVLKYFENNIYMDFSVRVYEITMIFRVL